MEWTAQEEALPPVSGGTYFGNANLGGLIIAYSPRGASSLTWFKLPEGDFMLLNDGVIFHRQNDAPETGWWWHGAIDQDHHGF